MSVRFAYSSISCDLANIQIFLGFKNFHQSPVQFCCAASQNAVHSSWLWLGVIPKENFFVFVILTAVLGIIGKNKRKRETEAALISRERDDLFGSRGFRIDGRGANRKRQRMLFTERYNNLTEVEFQSRYKLDKESFGDLVVRLTPVLAKDYAQAKRSSGSGISVELRLSATLRWLCGGAYQDICDLHGIHVSSFYGVLQETVTTSRTFSIARPHGCSVSQGSCGGVRKFTDGALKHAFGSVDGLLLRIARPTCYDTEAPSKFWCRKGFYAIVCQAVASVLGHPRGRRLSRDLPMQQSHRIHSEKP